MAVFFYTKTEHMFPFAQPNKNLEQRRQLQKQRLHHRLKLQSRQIERVMGSHQLPAHVSGGRVAPRVIQFDLQTQLQDGWDWFRVLTDDLRQALGVPRISISRDNGRLQVAVVRPADVPVRLLDLLVMGFKVGRETAVLGLSEKGLPVLLPLQEHVLISGVDGAGKTSLLRSLSMSLALTNRPSQLQQLMIAPMVPQNNAFNEFRPLTLLPHMAAHIAFQVGEAIDLLSWLVADMENRLQWRESTPVIVLMIDQVVELMILGGEPVTEAITALLQRGNEAGMYLVLTTSWPDSDLLDAYVKANLPQRIVGQSADFAQAAAASGIENSEAEYLLGRGDFLFLQDDGQIYFQAAYIGDYDLHMSLKKLQQQAKVALLAQPFSIRPELPEVVPDPIPASFWMQNGSAHFFDEEE